MCDNKVMDIGNRFREIRVSRGFATQQGFADHGGISRTQLVNIENNRYEPNIRTLKKLLNILGVTLEEFFTGQAPAYSKPDGVDKEERKYLDLLLEILRSGDKRAIMTMKLVIEQCGEKVNGRALKKEKAG